MFFIRIGLGILMLLCAVEILRMMLTLNNRELIIVSRRIGLAVLFFATFRIVGGFVDEHYFRFPYLTLTATYGFWIATYGFFWYHRRILQSDEIGQAGRAKISRSVDEIALEMRRFRKKLDRALEQ